MDKDKVIKRIKLLNRRIEIREYKKYKMVQPVSEYDWCLWKALEYEIDKAKEELEKILLEEFGHDYWDWIIDDTLKKSILND